MTTWRERIGDTANLVLKPLGAELRSTREPELWTRDPEFVAARARVGELTMMVPSRMFVLWQMARQAALLDRDADTAEIGVWRGGASLLVAELNRPRKHWALDTYTGLPEADADRLVKGAFADTSADAVRKNLASVNAEVIPGLFPDSAGPLQDRRFAFVHLDLDLHAGTDAGLRFFWPRLVTGGIVVVDDYGSKHEGVTRAVDEFVAGRKRERPILLAPGQCVLIKS